MSKKGSLKLIKQMNQDLVMDTIRKNQPVSRVSISRVLGMSRSTISAIVGELLKKKFIEELSIGKPSKKGGKPTIEYGFNPTSGFGVGVDIGGTKICIQITDLDGNPIYNEKVKTSTDVHEIHRLVESAIKRSGIDPAKVFTIGFGVPGITDSEKGIIIDAPALKWVRKPFIQEIQVLFDIPVFVNNDVNCAALGERWVGAAPNVDDMIFIAIGTGVGSAIISSGKLVQGHQYMAGEIGYLIGEEDLMQSRKNQVGQFGVFENKTSGTWLNQTGFSSETIFQAYQESNQEAVAIFKDYVRHLSIGIANMVSILNPEKVILGGGVSQSLQPLLEEIRSKVAYLTPVQTSIDLSSLGEKSGAFGAVAFALQQLHKK